MYQVVQNKQILKNGFVIKARYTTIWAWQQFEQQQKQTLITIKIDIKDANALNFVNRVELCSGFNIKIVTNR